MSTNNFDVIHPPLRKDPPLELSTIVEHGGEHAQVSTFHIVGLLEGLLSRMRQGCPESSGSLGRGVE